MTSQPKEVVVLPVSPELMADSATLRAYIDRMVGGDTPTEGEPKK